MIKELARLVTSGALGTSAGGVKAARRQQHEASIEWFAREFFRFQENADGGGDLDAINW